MLIHNKSIFLQGISMGATSMQLGLYRLKTALYSLIEIYRLPQEKIDNFLQSYTIFDKEAIESDDENIIVHYYSVLNLLCALGDVEKMYIPAVIDVSKGIIDNQVLFETKMSQELNIKPGDKVLDIGCGRGRVAAHLASLTKAHLTGINIDDVQLNSAQKYVSLNGLADKCQFLKASLNAPFPFADASFDALYQIQVLTYAKNKEAVFREMFRVLKPGGKLSFLDWVILDRYDCHVEKHRELLKRVKPLIGAVNTPTANEIKSLLEKVGFTVLKSQDASVGGHQAILIENADKYYHRVKKIIDFMVKSHLLPKHFSLLIDRLTKDGQSFVEADRLGLVTTSFQTIAQKPDHGIN